MFRYERIKGYLPSVVTIMALQWLETSLQCVAQPHKAMHCCIDASQPFAQVEQIFIRMLGCKAKQRIATRSATYCELVLFSTCHLSDTLITSTPISCEF